VRFSGLFGLEDDAFELLIRTEPSSVLVKTLPFQRLELRPSIFPGFVDGGTHIGCQHDKLGWSAIVIRAKGYDVGPGHSGRQVSEKRRLEQEWASGLSCI
jgi:hypothetical protein